MTRAAAGKRALITLVVAAVALAVIVMRDTQPSASTAGRAERLEEAALERFGTAPPKVRYGNGREVEVTDKARTQAMRVRLFTAALAREKQASDPGFRAYAEEAVAIRRPKEVYISWKDPIGAQELRTIVADSRDCGVDWSSGASIVVPAKRMDSLACIDALDGVGPGEDVVSDISIEGVDITRESLAWRSLVWEEMKRVAADEYLAAQ